MRQRLTVRSKQTGWAGRRRAGTGFDIDKRDSGVLGDVGSSEDCGSTNRAGTYIRERRSVRECALSLLEYRDRTEQELRQKLLEREYSEDEIEEAVLFLKEYRYLDDEAYAGRFIRSQSGKKSARQIRAALERKGVNREIIASCLEEEPVDEERQVRAFLEKKGYRAGERLEADAYRKLTAALARRGFSWDVIRRTMENMASGSEWNDTDF